MFESYISLTVGLNAHLFLYLQPNVQSASLVMGFIFVIDSYHSVSVHFAIYYYCVFLEWSHVQSQSIRDCIKLVEHVAVCQANLFAHKLCNVNCDSVL